MLSTDLESLVASDWTAPGRPGASRDLARVLADTGLPVDALRVLARLGMWVYAFDDHAEHADLAELEHRVDRYARLDPPHDPLGDGFRAVAATLRRTPLADRLWPLWTIQLAASLHAMVWERRVATRPPRSFDVYLEHATDSICVALAITSAAMLSGEAPAMPALVAAERHASIAVRLANDLACRAPCVNAVSLIGPGPVRARLAAERGALDAAVAALPAATGRFIVGLTDGHLATWDERVAA
jgi:hypothetical protein